LDKPGRPIFTTFAITGVSLEGVAVGAFV